LRPLEAKIVAEEVDSRVVEPGTLKSVEGWLA
jgi:hypothetical protein